MNGVKIKISGDKNITTLDKEYPWTHKSKIEQDFQSDSTSEPLGKSFDLTGFSNINFVIVTSDKPFSLTFTKASGDINIQVEKTFILCPAEALTGLTVISSTTEGQTFNLRVYEGE